MKSSSIIYKAIKAALVLVGKVELHWCPLPFLKKARGFDISGAEQRAVMNLLRPGDVLLGRFTHHLTAVLIPGDWDHAAIYVGDGLVVHITGEGVSTQDVLEFMERDGVAVLRFKEVTVFGPGPTVIGSLLDYSKGMLNKGIEYDYLCNFLNSTRLGCSELVQRGFVYAFGNAKEKAAIDLKNKPTWIGSPAYTPDDLFNSGLTVVHESKAWRKANKKEKQ